MSDLISRQAAMEEISKQQTYKMFEGEDTVYLDANDVGSVLASLPSAQPERKRGKWEIYVISMLDGEGCRCSECGLEGVPYWDFCPNCGADMREVDE